MEWIILGIILLFFGRTKKEKGIPWDPFLPPNYDSVHIDPKLQQIIDKHGVDNRKISPRYNNRR